MVPKQTVILAAVLPVLVGAPAFADDPVTMPDGLLTEMTAWAEPLSDKEMGELRGGYAGFAFNLIVNGTIAELANPGANVTSSLPPNVTVSEGMINIDTAVGSFNGASGIFQIANLENSSFNVINQNLFLQVAIIDVANAASIPTIQSLFDGTFAQ